MEHTMRFTVRHNTISLNQSEWYMSKRFSELKKRNISGLKFLANSMAPWPRWGMTVPIMEATAKMISRKKVSLTELKNLQIGFDLSF